MDEMTNLQTPEEIRRIIISDMVKKRNSIVPVIGEDTIVCSFGILLVLLWFSNRKLKLFRSVYEEVSKITSRYVTLTSIGSKNNIF